MVCISLCSWRRKRYRFVMSSLLLSVSVHRRTLALPVMVTTILILSPMLTERRIPLFTLRMPIRCLVYLDEVGREIFHSKFPITWKWNIGIRTTLYVKWVWLMNWVPVSHTIRLLRYAHGVILPWICVWNWARAIPLVWVQSLLPMLTTLIRMVM